MDRMFSVDDIAVHFWLPSPAAGTADEDESSSSSSASKSKSTPAMMNRSMSEWQFQRFLQEASTPPKSSSSRPNEVVKIKDQNELRYKNQSSATATATLKNNEGGRTTGSATGGGAVATTSFGASIELFSFCVPDPQNKVNCRSWNVKSSRMTKIYLKPLIS